MDIRKTKAVVLAVSLALVAALALPALAAEKTRVVCVGDSITKGAGIPAPAQIYPAQLGGILGPEYVVSGHGANATTLQSTGSRPYIKHREYKAAVAARPNIVVILLGANDAKPGAFKKDAFLNDLRAMVKSFQALPSKPKVFLCKPLPLIDDGLGAGSTKTLKEEITPIVEQVAKEMTLPLIDCYTPFEGKKDLLSDGVHPNADGAKVLAETVAAAIKAANKVEAKPAPGPEK